MVFRSGQFLAAGTIDQQSTPCWNKVLMKMPRQVSHVIDALASNGVLSRSPTVLAGSTHGSVGTAPAVLRSLLATMGVSDGNRTVTARRSDGTANCHNNASWRSIRLLAVHVTCRRL